MSQNRNDKRSIRYQQFSGGYAQALDTLLRAVLEGYRLGHFGRNEVRVFAARLEQSALHEKSSVSLYRIVNCHSKHKGNRRLSEGEIQTAVQKLDQFLPTLQAECDAEWRREEREPILKPVARKVLRHIARGGATTVEALLCFAYFMRRIPQRKPMQRPSTTGRSSMAVGLVNRPSVRPFNRTAKSHGLLCLGRSRTSSLMPSRASRQS